MFASQTEKVLAHDHAGKVEAAERKHVREMEAEVNKDRKIFENEKEKNSLKHDTDIRAAAAEEAYKNVDTH